jgi:hypothetical protein
MMYFTVGVTLCYWTKSTTSLTFIDPACRQSHKCLHENWKIHYHYPRVCKDAQNGPCSAWRPGSQAQLGHSSSYLGSSSNVGEAMHSWILALKLILHTNSVHVAGHIWEIGWYQAAKTCMALLNLEADARFTLQLRRWIALLYWQLHRALQSRIPRIRSRAHYLRPWRKIIVKDRSLLFTSSCYAQQIYIYVKSSGTCMENQPVELQ